ncbi:hypothetical protein HY480_01690, partial [Candidatus Uhrbacteria bacterium]|nr:hypothetical protein [Candidatus Uhrbacteria bacterium]
MAHLPPHDLLDATSSVDPSSIAAGHAEYLGTAVARRRIHIAFGIASIACVALVARAFSIQVIHGAGYRARAEQNRTRTEIIVPTRGTILDRHARLLVANQPTYAIGVIPADLPNDRTAFLEKIGAALHAPSDDLARTIAEYPRTTGEPVILRDGLTYDDAVRVVVAAGPSSAIRLLVADRRVSSFADASAAASMSHLTGYVGRIDATAYRTLAAQRYQPNDRIGRTGIEAAYEATLRGTPGVRTISVDARGRRAAPRAVEPAIAGQSVTLTIDRDLHVAVEHALRSGLRAAGARRGAAMLMDADDGAVLAMVSIPAFSATALSGGVTPDDYRMLVENPDHPLFPRAMSGVYPSGSTIKPF